MSELEPIDFMKKAMDLAHLAAEQDEVPVGAVVVREGKIIGQGYNTKEKDQICTRHAEIVAIEEASTSLNSWRLEGCELFVTLEPCLMCSGAILAARIDKVHFATRDPKGGACCSLYQTLKDDRLNHQCEVSEGLMQEEASQLLKSFFKRKRSLKKN